MPLPSHKILFSFQVHEKSILLAAIPVALMTFCDNLDDSLSIVIPWFLTISTFSKLPLLIKDGLLIPTIALSIMYLTIVINYSQFIPLKDKYHAASGMIKGAIIPLYGPPK